MAKSRKADLVGGHRQEFFMLLPMFIGFVTFTIYPVLWALRWVLYDYSGFGKPFFVGLDNFARAIFRDREFWRSMVNTFYLAGMKLIIEMPLAIVLAFFVNNKVRGSSILRIIYFLPTVFSIAVIGLVFSILFSAYNGIVNAALVAGGFLKSNFNFFGSRWPALNIVLLVSIWSTFGINMIYFLMGLQNIPNELYECATLDGASGSRQFFFITIPLLAPVMQIVFMLSLLGTMRITDVVLVMTNGQPGGTTEVAMTHILKLFFSFGAGSVRRQYGYGSALSIILGVILAIITIVYLKNSKRMKNIY
ncbi:sugar ABC transporter ATP-binding protein [Spirochaetia bacterium]|nr:sugar ABC transporter ATP-binding protein [Spirochaetia bacterium]GHU94399.1 sugar ABC transporter ATP-binding protein [Spirochaetia bacterium]